MIGQNIRKLRKAKGLSQEQFARKADIPFTTLNKIEIGDIKHPRIDTVGKIAGALKVKIDKLVNG
jgi:transcriptional regulator with XRE-family HTH domain